MKFLIQTLKSMFLTSRATYFLDDESKKQQKYFEAEKLFN